MKETTINQTLKNCLVITPRPIRYKQEFKMLYDRLFGEPQTIIEFLDTEDTQKKTVLARRFILRLIFDSNFPPAFYYTTYLAFFEKNIREKRSVKHPSRDHFLHLCYLYLLGIYAFFYSADLNEKIQITFSDTKYSDENNNGGANIVKSFISSWKYFVLYHDLAYPFEYLGNKSHEYGDIEKKIKLELGIVYQPEGISEKVSKSLSFRALSNIFAIDYTIKQKSLKPSNLFRHLKALNSSGHLKLVMGDNIPTFLDQLSHSDLILLKSVCFGDDIKYFLSFFPCSQFLVIFRNNSNIECILSTSATGTLITLKGAENARYVKDITNNLSLAFSDELYARYPNIDVEYYGIDLQKYLDDSLCKMQIIPSMLNNIVSNYANPKSIKRMKDLSFHYYYKLHETLMGEGDKANEILQENLSNLQQHVKDNILAIISKTITPMKIDAPSMGNITETTENITESFLREINIKMSQVGIIDTISSNTIRQIVGEPGCYKDSMEIYKKVCKSVNQNFSGIKNRNIDAWAEYAKSNYDELLSLLPSNTQDYISTSLINATSYKGNATDLLKSYTLKYSDYDHGITALWIFSYHMKFYRIVIDKLVDQLPSPNTFLSMCFAMPIMDCSKNCEQHIREKMINDYEQIISEVAYSLLIHNLYPSNFKDTDKKFITDDTRNSFAYFCMLIDALQNWGRPFNIDPLTEDMPFMVDPSIYNIKITDFINLTFFEDDPHKVKKYLEPHADQLDIYLQDASTKIKTVFKSRNK